jgi:hypothetical protein
VLSDGVESGLAVEVLTVTTWLLLFAEEAVDGVALFGVLLGSCLITR